MIITELNYQLGSTSPWIALNIQKKDATFSDKSSLSSQGTLITSEVKAYMAGITDEKDDKMKLLIRSGAIFKVKDISGYYHIIGNDDVKAQFNYEKKTDGKPGGKYGYEINISWKSISGARLIVL